MGRKILYFTYILHLCCHTPTSMAGISTDLLKKRPLNRHPGAHYRKLRVGVQQLIPRICVRLTPLLQVFRHRALYWPSKVDTMWPIRASGTPLDRTENGKGIISDSLCSSINTMLSLSSPYFSFFNL